jgi:glucose-1-phosphate thymidylyltransferase
VAWLDSGTYDSLLSASQFVQTVEQRQGLKIACIEEIAYMKGFIDAGQLAQLAELYDKSQYGSYLRQVLKEYPARAQTPR